jgi:hypothetical protein
MRLFMGVLALIILPLAAVAGEGRYQGVSSGDGRIFVVDTKTGKVIKWCNKHDCFTINDTVKALLKLENFANNIVLQGGDANLTKRRFSNLLAQIRADKTETAEQKALTVAEAYAIYARALNSTVDDLRSIMELK